MSNYNNVVPLVRIVHGSHLYGTSTPSSDKDFKGVHLPSGRAIILQRAEEVIDSGVVAKEGTKNTSDAIDEQSFSLQKFFGMLLKGDTVSTEILFATPLEQDMRWAKVQEMGKLLLNRECKGFVGYCVRQAAKYGVKGSRMAAVKYLVDLLKACVDEGMGNMKLETISTSLKMFAENNDHSSWINIPSPNSGDMWHIECCDRKMPTAASIMETYKVYSKVWENYGERARAAMTNEGIDWKAVSHAVRVARQAIELLTTGHITFPRPDAAELLEIKQGKIPYSEVNKLLEGLVEQVHEASANSILPEMTGLEIVEPYLESLYLEQIAGLPSVWE